MKNKLAARRKQLKLMQEQVAQELNMSLVYYQGLEYGLREPSVYVALRIARALDTTVEELFPVEDNNER